MSVGRQWLLAALSLFACGDDDGLPALPCDISQPDCERAIFLETARARGQVGARMPPSRIISREQFAQETRAELAVEVSTPRDLQFEEALQLLGLLPRGTSSGEATADVNVDGVAAYYRSDTKAVTIIADVSEDEDSGSLTLAHEYVHALQDEREGLVALQRDASSSDEIMATTSLIEGEATVLSDAVLAAAYGQPYSIELVRAYLMGLLDALLGDIAASPAPLNEGFLVLPYPLGSRPLAEAYAAQGYPGIQAFFRRAPRTLAGWVDPSRTDLPRPLRCDAPDAPRGYKQVGLDRLGLTGALALESAAGADGMSAFAHARGWTNDSYAVFAPVDDRIAAAVAWRLGYDTDALASLALARLSNAQLGFRLVQQGSELLVTAATDPAVLEAWTGRDQCASRKSLAGEQPKALFPHPERWLGARFPLPR